MMEYAKPPGFAASAPRRVFTAPPSQPTPQNQFAGSSGPQSTGNGLVETLYNHPSVKIVAFTAGPRTFSLSPGQGISAPPEVEPGTLPWSSRIERTIAVGPFRIYRAPGSVAFLSCGSALQPILPKSQCWCIDEISSKFVLQIRRPQYWRIEIPVTAGAEDSERAQALRDVFDKVLQFEKTPCPFQRAFTVELPERPATPAKKRPWTPVRKISVQLPPTPITPEDLTPRPALSDDSLRTRSSFSKLRERFSSTDDSPEDSASSEDNDTPTLPAIERFRREEALRPEQPPLRREEDEREEGKGKNAAVELSPSNEAAPRPAIHSRQLSGFSASRCVTAPPQLSLVTPKSSTQELSSHRRTTSQSTETSTGNLSRTDSSGSFHSLQSWHSPITPLLPSPPLSNPSSPKTFPYPHDNIALPQPQSVGTQSLSQDTSPTGATDGGGDELSPATDLLDETPLSASSEIGSLESFEEAPQDQQENAQNPSTPTQNSSAATATEAVSDPSRPRLRHRATTSSMSVSHNRTPSPFPPAANLITPRRKYRNNQQLTTASGSGRAKTRMEAVRRIPSAIIHKTCEILLSPPGHLINLMLKVAARIAAGEWRGLVFGVGESGERIPVHWDLSDTGSDAGIPSWESAAVWDDDVDNSNIARPSVTRTDEDELVTCGNRLSLGPLAIPGGFPTFALDPEEEGGEVVSSESWEVD